MSKSSITAAPISEPPILPAAITEAIAQIDAALATAAGARLALAATESALEQAKVSQGTADRAAASAAADAAVLGASNTLESGATAQTVHQQAATLATAAKHGRAETARLEHLQAALRERADDSALALAAARVELGELAAVLASEMTAELSRELQAAALPLFRVYHRFLALGSAVPGRAFALALSETTISDPANWQLPILDSDRIMVDGQLTSLFTTWQQDPAAVALAAELAPIQAALKRAEPPPAAPLRRSPQWERLSHSIPSAASNDDADSPPAGIDAKPINFKPGPPQMARGGAGPGVGSIDGNHAHGVAGADYAAMSTAEVLGTHRPIDPIQR